MKKLPDPMQWLHEGVPLALLLDLVPEEGPDSLAILRCEGGDAAWIVPIRVA